uniref:PHD-type domain-containing protein n=1 Tax=Caenorhabditis japonica TaxID=281687 RepID=A0A8R1HJB2_CAEJA
MYHNGASSSKKPDLAPAFETDVLDHVYEFDYETGKEVKVEHSPDHEYKYEPSSLEHMPSPEFEYDYEPAEIERNHNPDLESKYEPSSLDRMPSPDFDYDYETAEIEGNDSRDHVSKYEPGSLERMPSPEFEYPYEPAEIELNHSPDLKHQKEPAEFERMQSPDLEHKYEPTESERKFALDSMYNFDCDSEYCQRGVRKRKAMPVGRPKKNSREPKKEEKEENKFDSKRFEREWTYLESIKPRSVIDQALQAESYIPTDDKLVLGRLFGDPTSNLLCSTCSGYEYQNASWKLQNCKSGCRFMGRTPEEFEKMTDTCEAHYVNGELREKAHRFEDIEVKEERERKAYEKAQLAASKKYKSRKVVIKKEILTDEEDDCFDDDQDEEYVEKPSRNNTTKRKKQQIWNCPMCYKSSKFGSCGCCKCGEWFHLKCVGFASTRDVPEGWVCDMCKFSVRG